MDINEYLANSRMKRSEILKTAQSYLHRTTANDLGKSPLPSETEELYAGPNPGRLKQFENLVGNQLKKIFTPGQVENAQQARITVYKSVDDDIRKTYSRNKQLMKKKQLVIIPKIHNVGFIRIPKFIAHAKALSISPEIISERINKSWSKASKDVPVVRRSIKENLLFPVLSTAGTHEYRSKVYKY